VDEAARARAVQLSPMTPGMPDCRIIQATPRMAGLLPQSAHAICTSPPNWRRPGLGCDRQDWPGVTYRPKPGDDPITIPPMRCALGTEPTREAYVAHLIECFRACRAILRPDGTAWVNMAAARDNEDCVVFLPAMLAMAMQCEGWWVRSMSPWVHVRCRRWRPATVRMDYWMMFAQRPRYFYDDVAVHTPTRHRRNADWFYESRKLLADRVDILRRPPESALETDFNHRAHAVSPASYPPEMALPVIRAATPEKGCCPHCGAPWVRQVERHRVPERRGPRAKPNPKRLVTRFLTTGWRQDCRCPAAEPVPAVVFDPFAGHASTAVAALALGRRFIGTESSRRLLAVGRDRIAEWAQSRDKFEKASQKERSETAVKQPTATPATSAVQKIPFGKIRRDGGTQTRVKMDEGGNRGIRGADEGGDPVPAGSRLL
jgi:hypothetical protein